MRAKLGSYPRLGQYFKNTSEIADAAAMTRPTLSKVLNGKRELTEVEKARIYDRILVIEFRKYIKGQENKVKELLDSDFDTQFKGVTI